MAVNGGSSSIKFALFDAARGLERFAAGRIERIGLPQATFEVKGEIEGGGFSRRIKAPDHVAAVKILTDWIDGQKLELAAAGHRIVHGGPKYWEAQRITPTMLKTLRRLSPFDPEHLPEEISLCESFRRQFPKLPQVACFDTAFHHDMPRVARLLPIPRRYEAKGIRRYGFHGLSCTYLLEELGRLAGAAAARGRIILAHLGNGASITAVRGGRSIDTTMCFTPTAGLPMSTRSGDLDPGIASYLARTEKITANQFYRMVTRESGLLGISETSSDMRELRARAKTDVRAAEAVAVFCYQAGKWLGAMSAALQGLDTLVFAGGIGENAPDVRARICGGLEWLGIKLDRRKNNASAPIISAKGSRVTVRVIRTDEELVIARTVCGVLGIRIQPEK
jgi:acetate kinase